VRAGVRLPTNASSKQLTRSLREARTRRRSSSTSCIEAVSADLSHGHACDSWSSRSCIITEFRGWSRGAAGKGGRSRIYLQRATQSAGAKFRVRFCSAAHRRSSRGFPPYPSAHTSWPITRRSLRGPRTDLSSSSDHHPPAIRRSARVPRRVVPHRRGDVPWRESPLPIHVARHEEQEGIATSRRDACGAYRRTYPSIGRTVVARSRSQFDDGRER